MIARVSIALLATVFALTGTASAAERTPPTFAEARTAASMVLDTYMRATDSKFHPGPCEHRGKHSTVCRIRLVGPHAAWHQRFRVLVTTLIANYSVSASPLSARR